MTEEEPETENGSESESSIRGTRYEACVVEWFDSCTTPGWQPLTGEKFDISRIVTVGWIVKETELTLSISSSISQNGNAVDTITVPKSCVLSRCKLKQILIR